MGCQLSCEDILEDFKSFYYETALSGYDANLAAMETFVGSEKLLFGSDFPGSIAIPYPSQCLGFPDYTSVSQRSAVKWRRGIQRMSMTFISTTMTS
jgi:hypothetical protein